MNRKLIKRFFIRLYEKSFDEDIFSSSAQVGFYFLFALFPLLLFFINIFGFVLGNSEDLRKELFSYLYQVMPNSAYDLVLKTLNEVVEGSSGGKLTIGLLITLWSASAGIDSLRVALNAVYKLKEDRDWWKRKLMSLALILALGIMSFLALGIIFYGSQFINLILGRVGLPISSPFLLKSVAVVIVAILLLVVFDLLYYFIPDHNNWRWKWITPGAIVAIILWYLVSKAFGIYLQYFDTYAKTYGSLGAMIILMLWLYLTALAILIGGAINAILDEFSRGQFTKDETCADESEKTSDANNAKAAVEPDGAAPDMKKSSDSDSISPEKAEAGQAENSKLKIVAGGIIAALIGIFSFKNKR